MSNFAKSLETLISHEGGLTDNPSDRGGMTNFGITQSTLDVYLMKHGLPSYSVDKISDHVASDLYKELYWDPLQLDGIYDDTLATVVFDLAVLRGVPTMTRIIQSQCSDQIDGIMGPRTTMDFQQKAQVDSKKLALDIIFNCQNFFVNFAASAANQLGFLKGWMDRTQDLIRLVAE